MPERKDADISQIIKMRKINKNKYSFKGILFWIPVALLVAGFVYLTIETATSGAELANLERKQTLLAEENRNLADLLVRTQSLSSLDGKTLELGFSKPSQILYVNTKEEVAKLP